MDVLQNIKKILKIIFRKNFERDENERTAPAIVFLLSTIVFVTRGRKQKLMVDFRLSHLNSTD